MKKKKGNSFITGMVISFLIMIPILAIIVQFLNSAKDFKVATNIDAIANEYIMLMESKGYLSSQDEISLIQELSSIGVIDINLSGTTKTKVKNGERIYLKIKGNYNMKILKMDEKKIDGNIDKAIPIDITRPSISKV